jgi:(p)ppGpp synthase/HD superfamily hydrolase
MLARAIEIASKEFVNVTDKSGRPYILHCLWVMNKVRHLGDTYMIVAVLHDLIEDTHWTLEMLR